MARRRRSTRRRTKVRRARSRGRGARSRNYKPSRRTSGRGGRNQLLQDYGIQELTGRATGRGRGGRSRGSRLGQRPQVNLGSLGGVTSQPYDWGNLDGYDIGQVMDIVQGGIPEFGVPPNIGEGAAMDYIDYQNWIAAGGDDYYGGGGGGGGGGGEFGPPSEPQTAKFTDLGAQIEGAPEWWKALSPDIFNPISQYQVLTNWMIPQMSQFDQDIAGTNLFQSDPEQFAAYNPELRGAPGVAPEITDELRSQFAVGRRGRRSLSALDQLLSLSGKEAKDFGPGYNYLRSISDAMADTRLTGGASSLTETQMTQLLGTLDPLLAQGKSNQLSAFGPLSQTLVNPFFSAGPLRPGKLEPNRSFF